MSAVQHMVVVKFRPEVTSTEIDQVLNSLNEFWRVTRGIRYFAAGPYSSPEGLNQGFTHGFLVTFEDSAARNAYLVDPEHQRLVNQIVPKLDQIVAFDFEVPSPLRSSRGASI